jgi:prolipoprotein diacylglyceryl transferase
MTVSVVAAARAVPPYVPVPVPLGTSAAPAPAPAVLAAAIERLRAAVGASQGTPDAVPVATTAPGATEAGRRDGLIPAPPGDGVLEVGPLRFNVYGMMLGTAGLAGYGVLDHTLRAGGHAAAAAALPKVMLPAAAAGIVGARLYHVATDWDRYRDDPGSIPKVWEGGMAIYGGIAAGTLVGAAMARRHGIRVSPLVDAAAIALPLAQAIGRLGNYANQELFGTPTDLPWGLQVDPQHRPAGFEDRNSFHPTFAYEAAWNVALAGGLYALSKAWPGRPPGALFAIYAGGYGLGRFMVEGLRTDPAREHGGLRTNQWTSIGVMAASAGALALMVATKGRVRA